MKSLRRVHTILGCFFAPLLLFFIITGWHQMFHQRQKKAGEAATWWDRFSDVHVDQIFVTDRADSFSPQLFQWLVVAMAAALIVTVILGVVLAVRTLRPRWLVAATLGLGVAIPVLLLWLGQHRS